MAFKWYAVQTYTGQESRVVQYVQEFIDNGDLDGLEDGVEKYIHSTDPGNADTDGDGLSDYFEIQNGLDPLYGDSNTNGIGDFAEANLTNSIAANGSGGVLVVVPQTGWYHAVVPNLSLVYLGE